MPSSRPENGERIYEDPRLYDLAFSFRDIPGECGGLLALAARHGVREPRAVIELACGPGHHLREFVRRGLTAWGIDISPDMLAYAKHLCERDGVSVRFRRGDMRRFSLPKRADLALCMFDSFAHCTTDDDGVRALRSAAACLRRGGLLLIELSHPADYFDPEHGRTLGRWVERHDDVVVRARYDVSRQDAVEETYVATVTIDAAFRDGRPRRRIVSRQLHRMWLKSGIANIAARSGVFDAVGWYGDLATGVPLSMRLSAWRMVVVLRRR